MLPPDDACELSGGTLARLRGRRTGVLIASIIFCAIAPTLGQLQFGDPIENLNVATAMEIRRGGPWLFPTLQGEPRLAKPPLTAWVTAAFLSRSTLDAIDEHDPSVRARALEHLAIEARLPALLAMCAMLVIVYELARTVFVTDAGGNAGWISAVVCGSTFLFLRQCRLATTDAQLALWVSAANLFLAKAILKNRQWVGLLGAGAALGLGLMTKGPIALLQTAVPFGALVLWHRRRCRGNTDTFPLHPIRALPLLAGVVVMMIVGLTWYVCAAIDFTGARSLWLSEATRIGADAAPSGAPWYRYIVSCYLFLPWIIWLAAGISVAIRRRSSGLDAAEASRNFWSMRLSLLLLTMPLLLMSFSRDRYERYMTPMIPAAALLAAGVLSGYVACSLPRYSGGGLGRGLRAICASYRTPSPTLPRSTEGGRQIRPISLSRLNLEMTAHLLVTSAGILGFVIAGASGIIPALRTVSGQAWFTPSTAAALCAVGIGLLTLSAIANRHWHGWPILATAAVFLLGQAVYYNRLGQSTSSRSTLRPVADLILERFSDSELYAYRPGGHNIISVPANDLSIHLNRSVRLMADPSRIAGSTRPQIYVIYRTRKAGQPEMTQPRGWATLAKPAAGGNEDRYVFLRSGGTDR